MRERKKNNIIQLLNSDDTQQDRISVTGNGNITAGGDIHINKRRVVRPIIQPGPDAISPATARRIQKLVADLVDIEATGDTDRKRLFSKWWSAVKDRYEVATYREIPAHLGDQAIDWLSQQKAIKRPKLRRTNNAAWRKEHYKGIWAAAKQLQLAKGDVYDLVRTHLGKNVSSLKALGEQDLKKLYSIIFRMK